MPEALVSGVIDTHIHLSDNWKENGWLSGESGPFQRNWTEADLKADIARGKFNVDAAIFVECSNLPAIKEARWTLAMVDDPASMVIGVVAQVPCRSGGAAVRAFLGDLRGGDGKLHKGLKGGREVFLGRQMPPADACLDPVFLEGLGAMEEEGGGGLVWEWCCEPKALPNVVKVTAQFPRTTFVLDHMGHNNGGEDFASWSEAVSALAKLPNVVAKPGAIEQWGVKDAGPFLDHTLRSFGYDRVIAESNWMVGAAGGDPYDSNFQQLWDSLKRLGATEEEIQKVFSGNARRIYSL
eukprot:Hpha_TRINITY_DN15206_c1_g1::TRINITY_DN15206_c1_g1_i1::g.64490::m.64490/K07046/K07046; L-fuconolactonase